ncbi:galactokinase [Chryseobacterium sp. W4I1]|uniref:galactokinase n=1 Tax=Chryseobacterium sp. W4I1 TaxID=3042293 RepID=UPI00277F08F6|nr:galactokinase [Chryseobacterium sp. W4I1]MDQ0782494.1 galactokinase [Chryseobacterium sp. W4I1]
MHEQLINPTIQKFKAEFNAEPEHIFLSPGRINIIGEHVDYSDGFVLPAAIDKYICFAVRKLSQTNLCTIVAKDLEEEYTFDVTGEVKPVKQMWMNYILGVFSQLQKPESFFCGMEIVFSSTIPMGAGLSSSAALECGFAYILNELFDLRISKKDIAVIGQNAEHSFAGVQCGIMDQFASVFGKENKVIMLDCNSLEHLYFDADLQGYSLLLFDSCVKHSHLTSGYNERRKDVEQGKKALWKNFPEIEKFRDFTVPMLDTTKEEMGSISYKRCLYLLKEIQRVELAAKALSEGNIQYLGALLTETHAGLSTEFEVSCNELDFLVEKTVQQKGVLGARIMGGGFGGCSINLIQEDRAEEVIRTISEKYLKEFNIQMKVYHVKISDGIKEYTNEYIV